MSRNKIILLLDMAIFLVGMAQSVRMRSILGFGGFLCALSMAGIVWALLEE